MTRGSRSRIAWKSQQKIRYKNAVILEAARKIREQKFKDEMNAKGFFHYEDVMPLDGQNCEILVEKSNIILKNAIFSSTREFLAGAMSWKCEGKYYYLGYDINYWRPHHE